MPLAPSTDDNPVWAERTLEIDGKATPYGVQVAWPGVATFPGLAELKRSLRERPQLADSLD